MDNVGDRSKAWIEALKCQPSHILELQLFGVNQSFPLKDVLHSCSTLERLTLKFDHPPGIRLLESLVEHVPHLKKIHLDGVSAQGGVKHIWKNLKRLESLTIIPYDLYGTVQGTTDLYDGIALPDSCVFDLTLFLGTYYDLDRAAVLCVAFGARLRQLTLILPCSYSLPIVPANPDSCLQRVNEIKAACKNAAFLMECSEHDVPLVLKAFHDALLELRIKEVIECARGLESAAFCTRLRSINLRLRVNSPRTFWNRSLRTLVNVLKKLPLV